MSRQMHFWSGLQNGLETSVMHVFSRTKWSSLFEADVVVWVLIIMTRTHGFNTTHRNDIIAT
jgi:hypothetical protein